jgi:PPOX class probable F420-dependent enzyme
MGTAVPANTVGSEPRYIAHVGGDVVNRAALALLEQPGLLGVVATTRADGSAHAAPVWFRFAAGAIRIWTDEERIWVRNIRRDPRVSFSVHVNESPWTSVVIRGRATLADDPLPEVMTEIERISKRYLAPSEIESYIAAWPQTRSIVTIEPARTFVTQAFEDPVPSFRRR